MGPARTHTPMLFSLVCAFGDILLSAGVMAELNFDSVSDLNQTTVLPSEFWLFDVTVIDKQCCVLLGFKESTLYIMYNVSLPKNNKKHNTVVMTYSVCGKMKVLWCGINISGKQISSEGVEGRELLQHKTQQLQKRKPLRFYSTKRFYSELQMLTVQNIIGFKRCNLETSVQVFRCKMIQNDRRIIWEAFLSKGLKG